MAAKKKIAPMMVKNNGKRKTSTGVILLSNKLIPYPINAETKEINAKFRYSKLSQLSLLYNNYNIGECFKKIICMLNYIG